MTKLTTELVPGDVVVFADQRDKVLGIEKGMGVWCLHVQRTFTDGRVEQPVITHFSAGVLAEHEVVE